MRVEPFHGRRPEERDRDHRGSQNLTHASRSSQDRPGAKGTTCEPRAGSRLLRASAPRTMLEAMVTMRSAASSSRRRTLRRATGLGALVAVTLALGCGGESVSVDGDGGEAGEPSGGTSSGGSGATSGGTSGFGGSAGTGTGGSSTGGSTVEPPDTDPGCPDTSAPPGTYE